MYVKIMIHREGINVVGAGANRVLRAVGHAMLEMSKDLANSPLGEKPGLGQTAELMAAEFRAHGAEVDIHFEFGAVLVHRGCAHAYTEAEWNALPHFEMPMPSASKPDATGFVEMRNCDGCGSTITLASVDLHSMAPSAQGAN
jgi:hypothetical protein